MTSAHVGFEDPVLCLRSINTLLVIVLFGSLEG